MKRRNGWIALTFGIILALCTGGLVFFILQQQQVAAAETARSLAAFEGQPETVAIPVAARPLAAGATLTAEDYVLKDIPVELVPSSAISTTVALEGQTLVQPVGQGEMFSLRQIRGGAGATASQQIEPGFVLFAFPIVDLMSQVNVVEDGDHIDLLLTLPTAEGASGISTAITLQNIEVFRVIHPKATEENPDTKPTALLLSMKPEDAVMVKFIKDSGGIIDFTLRPSLDDELKAAPSVNESELVTRYQFR